LWLRSGDIHVCAFNEYAVMGVPGDKSRETSTPVAWHRKSGTGVGELRGRGQGVVESKADVVEPFTLPCEGFSDWTCFI